MGHWANECLSNGNDDCGKESQQSAVDMRRQNMLTTATDFGVQSKEKRTKNIILARSEIIPVPDDLTHHDHMFQVLQITTDFCLPSSAEVR